MYIQAALWKLIRFPLIHFPRLQLFEVMLQHWPWLESGDSKDDSDSLSMTRSTTVSETEAYVKHYLDKMVPEDLMRRLDVKTTVKDIFERAGFTVSARE